MTGNHQTLALLLFSAFVAVTLGITTWVSRNRHGSAEELMPAGGCSRHGELFRHFGDYMSAASFLGVTGLISLYGYDGLLYVVGFLVAWWSSCSWSPNWYATAGGSRSPTSSRPGWTKWPWRIAAGTSSVTVSVLYLVAQMVGAGSLVALLLGGSSEAARNWTVIGVGALMVIDASLGGMRATTWIQIVKAVLLLSGSIALTVLVLVRFHGTRTRSGRRAAAERSGHGDAFLAPGLKYGGLDGALRLHQSRPRAGARHGRAAAHPVAFLGPCPRHRAARRSVVWSIGLLGGFYLDDDRAGLRRGGDRRPKEVRERTRRATRRFRCWRSIWRRRELRGGMVPLCRRRGHCLRNDPRGRRRDHPGVLGVRGARPLRLDAPSAREAPQRGRRGAYGGGGYRGCSDRARAPGPRSERGLPGGPRLRGRRVREPAGAVVLAVLAKFTTRGAVWPYYGGLVPALLLVLLSPVVTGSPDSLFPSVDFQYFPLQNPGLVSIPLGFLAGWLGTVTSAEPPDEAKHAETEVRSLTGAGAV